MTILSAWVKEYADLRREFESRKGKTFFGEWGDFMFCKILELNEQVAALEWKPITPDNLPKTGDEVFTSFGDTYTVPPESDRVWENCADGGWTHVRQRVVPKEAQVNDLLSECAEIGCHKLTQEDYCGVHSAERRRRDRIASGVCARCGDQPIDLAYESYCEECARKHRSYQRRQYAR